MSTRTVEYNTNDERAAAIATAESAGWVLLNDDFNVGVTKAHKLTFEDAYVEPSPPAHPLQSTWDTATTDAERIQILAQGIGLA